MLQLSLFERSRAELVLDLTAVERRIADERGLRGATRVEAVASLAPGDPLLRAWIDAADRLLGSPERLAPPDEWLEVLRLAGAGGAGGRGAAGGGTR